MDDPEPQVLTVPERWAGARLDRALTDLLGGLSRVRVQELIHDGGVRVEGEPIAKPSHLLETGWTIEILAVARSRERTGGDEEGPLDVVHEDEHLVVIDKAAGVVAHPSTIVRGGTVSERAVAQFGPLPSPQGEDRPGIVHRLDADTSGLLVLARTEEAAEALMEAFRERRVEKRYLALVFGAPRFDSDWIDASIGRARGRPDRMSVTADEDGGREAHTFYETQERFPGFGFVACRPTTGRTHQIRVHMASIEHPLVGDRVYRGRKGLSREVPRGAPKVTRHMLHAAGLAFDHPVTGERLSLEAPLPQDFEAWLAFLRRARMPGSAE